MRHLRSLAVAIGFVAITLIASPMSAADRTISDRTSSAFWSQFAIGESSLDVYSALGRLVLTTSDAEKRATILMWDGASFTLFVRGTEITDLTTSEDAQGRPTFAGNYCAGVPQLTGFVDITPDGNRIVQIYEDPEVVNARWETAFDGSVLEEARCECAATQVSFACESKHCNWVPPPHCNLMETVRCGWLVDP